MHKSFPQFALPLLAFIPIDWSDWNMEEWSMVVWMLSIAGYILSSGVKFTKLSDTERGKESRVLRDMGQRVRSGRSRS